MRRFAAIWFLFVLLFNLFGYRIFIDYLQAKEIFFLNVSDDKINDQALISIKVAAVLPPYFTESKSFEWTDGEININGIIYQCVKRKIQHDSIEYLCVPNNNKMRYQTAKDDFFKLSNDLVNDAGKKVPASTILKPAYFDFYSSFANITIASINYLAPKHFAYNFFLHPFPFISCLEHPPQWM